MLRSMKALHELSFHNTLLAIDILAGLVTYLAPTGGAILLVLFLLWIGSESVEMQETILCSGALLWSFSRASDANKLSLIPYAE